MHKCSYYIDPEIRPCNSSCWKLKQKQLQHAGMLGVCTHWPQQQCVGVPFYCLVHKSKSAKEPFHGEIVLKVMSCARVMSCWKLYSEKMSQSVKVSSGVNGWTINLQWTHSFYGWHLSCSRLVKMAKFLPSTCRYIKMAVRLVQMKASGKSVEKSHMGYPGCWCRQ